MISLREIPERILDKIEFEPNSGCWLWAGKLGGNGYGQVWWKGRLRPAHRTLWEIANKTDAPKEFESDHLCRTSLCVNPGHVEIVSHSINQLRGLNGVLAGPGQHFHSRKTHCPAGHPYSGSNLLITQHKHNGGITRRCRACWNATRRRYRKRKKHGLI